MIRIRPGASEDIAKLLKIITRVERLSPSNCTLHVPFTVDAFGDESVRKWQDIVYRNLAEMLKSGVPAERIAIESLNYPFTMMENIIKELKLFICMDIGHLIIRATIFRRFSIYLPCRCHHPPARRAKRKRPLAFGPVAGKSTSSGPGNIEKI